MYQIEVDGSFNATHCVQLADGRTEPVHGHDWRLTVCLSAETTDRIGFVADFDDVTQLLGRITKQLHHTHLNDHPWLAEINPTAEAVARMIFDRLAHQAAWSDSLKSVTVVEAPGCRATYVSG